MSSALSDSQSYLRTTRLMHPSLYFPAPYTTIHTLGLHSHGRLRMRGILSLVVIYFLETKIMRIGANLRAILIFIAVYVTAIKEEVRHDG